LAFASLVRSEHIWSLDLDTSQPRTVEKAQAVTQGSGTYTFPSVSRDGSKLAYLSEAAYNDEVWLLDMGTGKKLRLSNDVSQKFKPVIHADGSRVMWTTAQDGATYAVPASGGAAEKLCDRCGWVWDWSADHKQILYFGNTPTPSAIRWIRAMMVNFDTGKRGVFLERPGNRLYQFHWSPDGRWIVFMAQQIVRSQVFVAPYRGDEGPGEAEWIPITDGSSFERNPQWAPDGNWIYAKSDLDGFTCLWAYPLDPRTKRLAGKPVAVFHSHGSRLSLRNANEVSQEMSVAKDRIVFNQGEITGNIWMTEIRPR
jgi:Tol biopolymer transport system component